MYMKLIFIFLYIVLSSHLYSQISGEYFLESVNEKKVIFNIKITFDKKSDLVVPPINFKTNKVLKEAKLVKMQSLAQDGESLIETYVYSYEIDRKKLKDDLPSSTITYLVSNVQKSLILKGVKLPVQQKNDDKWIWVVCALFIVMILFLYFQRNTNETDTEQEVDLQTLWETNQVEKFLQNAIDDERFAIDKKMIQEYYDQVKYAGVELNSRQKSQIEKNFKEKKNQIKNVQKEQEDQFLASVLED